VENPAGLSLQPDSERYTLPRFLRDVAGRYGDASALRFGSRDWSYREIDALAREFAKGLIAVGAVKGTRVGLLCANRPEWVVAAFAASMTGAVVIPVNTFATSDERDHILRHSDVSILIVQRALANHRFVDALLEDHLGIEHGIAGAIRCEALPQLRRVVGLDLEAPIGAIETGRSVIAAGESVSDALIDEIAREISPADDALVIYTSGTTAQPKGVAHRHRAPIIQAWRFAELMGLCGTDRVYTAQPFFWTAGIAMSLGASFAAGATLILEETFDAGRALECIERERATTVHAWPHQEKSMAEHPEAARRDLSSVRHVEFANPLARVIPLEHDEWGMYGSYGLSETFTLATALDARAPADLRQQSHGDVLAGNELRIVDPDSGVPLRDGEKGEIALRGLTLMSGYAKVEPENYLDEGGWFRTQDGGWLDEHGRLHWKGRLSNLIKTGGANVSPLEIESALAGYPGVKAAHAVGIAHPTLGEAIVLCLIPTSEAPSLEPDAVLSSLREKVARYKIPRAALVLTPDEVSYTGSQKVRLEPLRALVSQRLGDEGIEIAGYRYGW
jgi:fatty-acyl-CoA synthase